MKAKITLEFDDLASAAVALLALRGPLPTFTVVPHPPTVVSTEQAAPAPAPQETVSDREVVATPVTAAPTPRRTRKDAKTGAANAPADTGPAQEPATPVASVATPPAAAPVAASTEPAAQPETVGQAAPIREPEASAPAQAPTPAAAAAPFVPPLGPTFTLDKPKTAAPVTTAAAGPVPSPNVQAPAAAVPAIGKVQEAVEAVLAAKGTAPAMASLSRFGVKRGRELLESQRADFIAYCADVVAGKVDPVAGSGVTK